MTSPSRRRRSVGSKQLLAAAASPGHRRSLFHSSNDDAPVDKGAAKRVRADGSADACETKAAAPVSPLVSAFVKVTPEVSSSLPLVDVSDEAVANLSGPHARVVEVTLGDDRCGLRVGAAWTAGDLARRIALIAERQQATTKALIVDRQADASAPPATCELWALVEVARLATPPGPRSFGPRSPGPSGVGDVTSGGDAAHGPTAAREVRVSGREWRVLARSETLAGLGADVVLRVGDSEPR